MMTCYMDVIRPARKTFAMAFDILAVLLGSFFIALVSQVAIPLGFTPVPLTMQTLAILLIGGVLGSKRGAFSVLTYLFQGAIGLPVFFHGGSGLAILMGPTGGYLLGFVVAAYVVGYLLERGWKESYALSLAAMAIGSLAILVLGAMWLGLYVGSANALRLGLYPFIIGDVVKMLIAASLIPTGWKALNLLK